MKTLVLLCLVVLGGEARAQGSGHPSGAFDGIVYTAIAWDSTFMAMGLITGVGSSIMVSKGRMNKGWFYTSIVSSVLNLGLGVAALGGASELAYGGQLLNPAMTAFAVAHLAIGFWNALMPLIGFLNHATDSSTPRVEPVFVTGRGGSGKRFSGLGVQIGF